MADVGGVDLNLLLALGALLEDRNLTRAGVRIGMSQPAMSAAPAAMMTAVREMVMSGSSNKAAHPTARA